MTLAYLSQMLRWWWWRRGDSVLPHNQKRGPKSLPRIELNVASFLDPPQVNAYKLLISNLYVCDLV